MFFPIISFMRIVASLKPTGVSASPPPLHIIWGSLEKQSPQDICRFITRNLSWELALVIMEATMSHNGSMDV